MSSSHCNRHNARSSRGLARTSFGRSPSSHSHQRHSPGLSATATATPLWGPALWNNLLATGREDQRTLAPRVEGRAARPVLPPRSRALRHLCNKTPACFDDDSDSRGEEELEGGTVTKMKTRMGQGNKSNRYQRIVQSISEEEEEEEEDDMLSTAKVNEPPVGKKTILSNAEKMPAQNKAKSVGPAIVTRKRNISQHRTEAEHLCKIQKTNELGSNASAPKHGSPQTLVLLDDSNDDTPLVELWSRSRDPPVKVEEEAPLQKGFFSGLGVRSLGSNWSVSRNNAGAGAGASAKNAAEDARVNLSPVSGKQSSGSPSRNFALYRKGVAESDRGAPGERSSRSVSRNFSLYQKDVADSERSATRIAELERELENCKRDREATINALECEHKAALSRLNRKHNIAVDIMQREHNSAARDYETRIESERQKGEANLKSEAETKLLETKKLFEDIQRTATFQDDERTRQLTALKAENKCLSDENQSLKSQLSATKTTLEQREVLVPTEESVKALEARNLALAQELKVLKQRHLDTPPQSQSQSQSQSRSQDIRPPARPPRPLSPTPTLSSSLRPSDETKTTNVRNMFLKVKRRHDNLVTVAKRILETTTGMDLAAFGEFGRHLRELRRVLQDAVDEVGGGRGGGRQGGRGGAEGR
ncbi:hypothetical protein PMIN07_001916 [Paraphaeosphaeria minitans]